MFVRTSGLHGPPLTVLGVSRGLRWLLGRVTATPGSCPAGTYETRGQREREKNTASQQTPSPQVKASLACFAKGEGVFRPEQERGRLQWSVAEAQAI